MLGAWVHAGHDPNHVLSTYSFEQIALHGRLIIQHDIATIDMVMRPLLGAAGFGFKSPKVDDGSKKTKDPRDRPGSFRMGRHDTDAAKEAGLLQALSGKVRVRTVVTSGKADGGEG